MTELFSKAVGRFNPESYPDGAFDNMSLPRIFSNKDIDKRTVEQTFALAGLSGYISIEDHTEVQWVLLNWDDENVITNAERFATISLYDALNEMARHEDISTEPVMTIDELFQPVANRIATGDQNAA